MAEMTGAGGTKTINQSRRVRSLGGNTKKKTQRKPKEKVRSKSLRRRS